MTTVAELDPPYDPNLPNPRIDPGPPVGTANSGGATVEFSSTGSAFSVLDPTAKTEQLVLGDLFLNDGDTYTLEEFSCPPPRKRAEWVAGGDSNGSALVRDPLYENREVTVKLRVGAASMDAALSAIAELNARMEQAEIDPVELLWMPAGATNYLTFYVLSGEVTDLPISIDSGWLFGVPTVSLTLTCKPFGYGPWRNGLTAANTGSFPPPAFTLNDIAGDVAAEARLTLADVSGSAWRHVEWGIELGDNQSALFIDSDQITGAPALQGILDTMSGGVYDPNNSAPKAIQNLNAKQQLGETQLLALSGTYRVRARLGSQTSGTFTPWVAVRSANGPIVSSAPVSQYFSQNWMDVDLGLITVPSQWGGAYVSIWNAEMLDTITLIPVDGGYGKAVAEFSAASLSTTFFDNFATGAGQLLGARTGWSSSGSGTDFTAATWPLGTDMAMRVTTGATRYASYLGSTQPLDSIVEVDVAVPQVGAGRGGVMARFKDSSNYLVALYEAGQFELNLFVGGSLKRTLTEIPESLVPTAAKHITLATYANGHAVATFSESGRVLVQLAFVDSDLKATGALGSGTLRAGLYGTAANATGFFFNDFTLRTAMPERVVVGANQSAVISSDEAVRRLSATETVPMDSYRGARLFLPPLRQLGQTARMLIKARQQNVEDFTDDLTTTQPNLNLSLDYRARYVVVPYE